MALTVGSRLGHYDVTALIGEGGMGQVYQATDTKLNRQVALKILPEAFATDPDRLARFQREAQVLASLNHPNIAAIYGLEEADDTRALVLELVEGPTLADRITQGPVPVDDALPIAKQIAEALEAAHEAGVIHRDLKPANIKVKDDGTVKVLDFGLAKALDTAPQGDPSQSPTLTAAATQMGVIMGTAAYMSPEQARGSAADKRADIWAFGCVLFEMLTAQRVFKGGTVSDVLAAVLRVDPEWQTLPPDVHPRLRLMLERCLEKKPKNRYHDIADARVDVQAVLADPQGGRPPEPEAIPTAPPWGLRAVAAVAVAATVVGAVAGRVLRPLDAGEVSHLSLVTGDEFFGSAEGLNISGDGSQVVYRAGGQLNLRQMQSPESTPIRGTEGFPGGPFFSPNGQSIGYFDDGEIRRIAVSGGTPVSLAEVVSPHGASWYADGTIVFASESGIWRVSENGGDTEHLVQLEDAERVYGPQVLPNGESVLFTLLSTAMGSGAAAWDAAQVVVQSLETGDRRTIIDGGSDARYVPTGHVVYALSNVLFAVPFDTTRLEVLAGPVPMVEAVQRPARGPSTTGAAGYGVSDNGNLVYVPGVETPPAERQLLLVDQEGKRELLTNDLRDYWRPRLSPDGQRVVVEVMSEELGVLNLWTVDVASGSMRQLTFGSGGSGDVFPAWTPDGQEVAFSSGRSGTDAIYRQSADGTGGPETIFEGAGAQLIPNDVSADGVLAFTQGPRVGQSDILGVWLTDGSASELVSTPAVENMPMFSPNGQWLAYVSNVSGRSEIWVRELREAEAGEWRVSNGGGVGPVWSRDGSELYYRGGSGDLMVVSVESNPGFTFGPARSLFPIAGQYRFSANTSAYDVDSNGRFIMVTAVDSPVSQPSQINVVLNWFEELKQKAPVP